MASGIQGASQFSLPARTGHGAVYHADTDRLWVFGGKWIWHRVTIFVRCKF